MLFCIGVFCNLPLCFEPTNKTNTNFFRAYLFLSLSLSLSSDGCGQAPALCRAARFSSQRLQHSFPLLNYLFHWANFRSLLISLTDILRNQEENWANFRSLLVVRFHSSNVRNVSREFHWSAIFHLPFSLKPNIGIHLTQNVLSSFVTAEFSNYVNKYVLIVIAVMFHFFRLLRSLAV